MATTDEAINNIIEFQGWTHETQAMLFRRFIDRQFQTEMFRSFLANVAAEEDEISAAELARSGDAAPLAIDNRPAVPLDELQAIAVFLGWDPEEQGPVDEASDGTLALYFDHHAGWAARRFRVNGDEDAQASELILANREDPVMLAAVGALDVGQSLGGGAGGDVTRLPDALEEILCMDNGLAPEGWVEIQADNEGDAYPMDETAAMALDRFGAMLYRVATGEMAQACDEEACTTLAGRVNEREDGTPALIVIVPRASAVAVFGEKNVPR